MVLDESKEKENNKSNLESQKRRQFSMHQMDLTFQKKRKKKKKKKLLKNRRSIKENEQHK